MRAWVSGQVIAFDDSFEHEVMAQALSLPVVRFLLLSITVADVSPLVCCPQVRHYCGRSRSENPLRAARQRVVFQVWRAVR